MLEKHAESSVGEGGGSGAPISRRQVLHSGMASVVRIPLGLAISFFLTPFILWKIGVANYGLLGVLNMVSGYLMLLDFGMAQALSKYLAEMMAKGDENGAASLLDTMLATYAILGITGSLVVYFALRGPILRLLGSRGEPALLGLTLVAFVLNFCTVPIKRALIGLHRLDLSATVALLTQVMGAIGTVAVLWAGLGVEGMLWNSIAAAVFALVLTAVLLRRRWRAFSLWPSRLRPGSLPMIFNFGFKVQFVGFAAVLSEQLPITLMATYLNLQDVGYYRVANRFLSQIRGVPFAIMPLVAPVASALNAVERKQSVLRFYLRAIKYLAMVSFPVLALTAALVLPFVSLWLGTGYRPAAEAVLLVLPGYVLFILADLGLNVLNGIGHPEINVYASWGVTAIIVVLGVILTRLFGYYGTVAAVGAALFIGWGYAHALGARFLGSSFRETLGWAAHPLIASAVCGILVAGGLRLGPGGYLGLVLWAAVFLVLYGAYFLRGPGLDAYDRTVLNDRLPKVLRIL